MSARRTVEGSWFVPNMFLGLVSLSCQGIYVSVLVKEAECEGWEGE